jgi:hypothetical protein
MGNIHKINAEIRCNIKVHVTNENETERAARGRTIIKFFAQRKLVFR